MVTDAVVASEVPPDGEGLRPGGGAPINAGVAVEPKPQPTATISQAKSRAIQESARQLRRMRRTFSLPRPLGVDCVERFDNVVVFGLRHLMEER